MIASISARIENSLLAKRFIGGAAWSVAGAVLTNGITLITMLIVARILEREVYGQFVAIQSTLSMVGTFAGFGIGTTATRYTAELRQTDLVRLGHILTLAHRSVLAFGLIASLGLAFGSQWMGSIVLNSSSLAMPLSIAAWSVLFMALDGYQKSVLIGLESMRSLVSGAAVASAVSFPIMLIAAHMYALNGAATAIVVGAIFQFTISRYQALAELRKHGIRWDLPGSLREWPILWGFAFPSLISSALVGPAHWATQALLANSRDGFSQLAILGVCMQWFNVIMFLPGTAGRIVLPILTDQVTNNNAAQSRKILKYAVGANALVAVPASLVVIALSRYILGLYGKGYQDHYTSLVLASIVASFVAVLSPIGAMLAAASRMWLGVLMNAGWALAYVGLSYLFIGRGVFGVLSALCIAYLLHSIWAGMFALLKVTSDEGCSNEH